jgi:hypothetical protein
MLKFSYIIGFSWQLRCRQNAPFHIAFSAKTLSFTRHIYPKLCKFASSLNSLYTPESAQFHSVFSLTTISLILHSHQKRQLLLCFFAEDAHYSPKPRSCKDNAKYFSNTLRYTTRFGKNGKWSIILNIWANLKKTAKNVGYTVFGIYYWMNEGKKG